MTTATSSPAEERIIYAGREEDRAPIGTLTPEIVAAQVMESTPREIAPAA